MARLKRKQSIRNKLKKKQHGLCQYCQSRLKKNAHIDHIVPQCKNGSNDIDNLCLACPRCNTIKGGLSLSSWLRMLKIKSSNRKYKYWRKWNDEERLVVIDRLSKMVMIKPDGTAIDIGKITIGPQRASTIHKQLSGLSNVLDSD